METKLIFSPQLAQGLLNHDCHIVDLKPKRGAPNETVFVFIKNDHFNRCVQAWLANKKIVC